MVTLDCRYELCPGHEWPDDWEFGGPTGLDPRADARWRGPTYIYFDDKLEDIALTMTPLCDEQAIDEFTKIANLGPGFNPVYLAKRFGRGPLQMLPVQYDKTTDEVHER